MTRPPDVFQHTDDGGVWTLTVEGVNRTFFRNVPVKISSLEDTDPFGPSAATFSLPQVSPLEPVGNPGTDLDWLVPDARVEITYVANERFDQAARISGLTEAQYSWKGFIVSFSWKSESGGVELSVDCVGALRILDNILAMDSKVSQPYSYEAAIKLRVNEAIDAVGVDSRGDSRIDKMDESGMFAPGTPLTQGSNPVFKKYDPSDVVVFDGGATDADGTVMRPPAPRSVEWWRIPKGVKPGDYWSGMLTRDLGNNNKLLTEYVNGLLEMMYTSKGRVSMRLAEGTWKPELFHQYLFQFADNAAMLQIDAASPGVGFSMDQDFTQSVTTVYGAVSSNLDGSSYDGEEFTIDGKESYFEPFADVATSSKIMPREQFIQFTDGLGVGDALQQSREHVSRNSEPGFTGTITLNTVDPRIYELSEGGSYGGELLPFPRQLLRPGMYVRLNGFQGRNPGIALFVTQVSHDVESNTTTLNVDSKSRDFVTVDQVRVRGRDSMAPVHLMNVGEYSGQASDRIYPWSPSDSGFLPDASKNIWRSYAASGVDTRRGGDFPWLDLVRKYPPSRNPGAYAYIPATTYKWGTPSEPLNQSQVNNYWFPGAALGDWIWEPDALGTGVGDWVQTFDSGPFKGNTLTLTYLRENFPNWDWGHTSPTNPNDNMVRLGAGNVTAQALKIMCVDVNGNPLPVSFYFALYSSIGFASDSGPALPGNYPEAFQNNPMYPSFKLAGEHQRYYEETSYYPFFPYAGEEKLPDGTTEGPAGQEGAALARIGNANNRLLALGSYWERPGWFPLSMQDDKAAAQGPTGQLVYNKEFSATSTQDVESLTTTPWTNQQTQLDTAYGSFLIFCDDLPNVAKYFIGRIYVNQRA